MSSEDEEGGARIVTKWEDKALVPQNQRRYCRMAESSSSSSSNGSSSSAVITRIPQDHLFSILLLLPIESILCFAMTCKRLKSLAYSDTLWEAICRRDWGDVVSRDHLPWKVLYQRVYRLDSLYCHALLAEADSPPGNGDGVLPTPRASHSLNMVSGCLVLFGGGCDGGRHLDDTWAAYIGSDLRRTLRWQKTNSGIPSGRFGHSCVVIGDCVVLFGGINDHGIRQNDTWVGQVTVHERLGITLSWRLLDIGLTTPPPPPRGAHAGCFIDNKKMLIHGGIGPPGVRLADTWVLDLDEDLYFGTWREIVTRTYPPSRSGHTLTHIGGAQTILFGGRGMGYEVLNDVWVLDASEGHWKWGQLLFDLRNIPQGFSLPRVGHSANLIIGRRLLIHGGEDSYRHRKDDFWVLDVGPVLQARNTIGTTRRMWRRIESIGDRPSCRSFHGACVDETGQYMYVYGGMVDGLVQPADPSGLRFDGGSFLVELVLHS